MPNESRLSITIDSRSAEQQAKDLEIALDALDKAGIRVVNTADRTGKTTTAAGRTFSVAGKQARDGSGGVDQMNSSLQKTDASAATAAATLSRLFIAATAGFSAMSLIDAADSWGQMASRVKQATESQAEYELVMSRTAVSARETYRSLDEARELFVRTSEAIRGLGHTLEESIDLTDSFSFLLVTNAASAERGASAINAYSKAIQTGKVDSESWQSILQAIPTVVDRIAESTGKSAAEIRKLGIEGKLSLGDLNKSLLESLEVNRKAAADMPTTVRDAIQNVGNAFKEYIGWQNEASGTTAAMAAGLGVLGDNFETIANIAGGVAAAALFVYTARTIESTRATIASFTARTAAAKATLDEAQAQAASTATTLADARAKLGLTATLVQLTAAEKIHEAALKQVAIAQAGYTRAGMALLGVLGGPVGLGITAALTAASFLVFKSSTSEASAAAQGLTREIDALNTSTKELTQNQAKQAILELGPVMDEAQAKVRLLEDNIAGLSQEMKRIPPGTPLFAEFEDALTRARGDLDTATGAVGRLASRLSDLKGVAAGAGQAVAGAAAGLSDEYLKLEGTLNKQIALLGKTGQAAQYRYDLEHGELSKLSDSEKALAKIKIDKLEADEKALDASKKGAKASAAEAKEIDGILKTLHEQVGVLGMTEQQAARYRIETAKGTDTQKRDALAMLEQVQAQERLTKAKEAYKSLLLDLRTDDQRAVDLFKEQKKALDEAGVSAEDYARVMSRISEVGIGSAPKFGGLDASVGGASGELVRVAEAQAELEKWRSDELARQQAYLNQKLISEQQYADNVLNITRQLNEQQANLQASWRSATLATFSGVTNDASEMLRALGQEGSTAYKVLFLASKAASIAQAWINTELAATRALAELGPIAGPPMAGVIRGLGYASIGIMSATAITGMAHDGIDQIPREGTWLLDKGERVLSPRQNSDLTNYLKQASNPAASSGNITIQVVVNAETGEVDASGADDPRWQQIGTMIAASARQVIIEEQRPHGLLDRNR